MRISKGLALAAAGFFVGCSGGSSTGSTGKMEEIARSNQERITAPQVASGDLATLTAGNDAFAVDLYQTLRSGSGNMVFSPESISIALAMTYGGAAGMTATQMATALHFSLPPERLHPAFDALDLALTAPGSTSGAFLLTLANALWAQQGFALQPSFLELLAENYGVGVRLVDFEGAPETARQSINQWVSQQTAGKITELLPSGTIDELTRLVLTNAVYFKAAWQTPFNPKSPTGTFQAPAGPVSVPMMSGSGTVPVWTGPGYTAAALPYAGGTTSMVLIVPDAGTFGAFETVLTTDTLATVLAAASAATMQGIALPRFQIGQHFSVRAALTALGMTDAFAAPPADFSGIDGGLDLFISDVIHQADVTVDEQGTEAAAATAVILQTKGALFGLSVDRPFIFLIRDEATGATLFMGRVLDPSQ